MVSDSDRTSPTTWVHFRLPTHEINEKSDSWGGEAFLVPRRARRDKSYSRRLLLTVKRWRSSLGVCRLTQLSATTADNKKTRNSAYVYGFSRFYLYVNSTREQRTTCRNSELQGSFSPWWQYGDNPCRWGAARPPCKRPWTLQCRGKYRTRRTNPTRATNTCGRLL